MLGVINPPPPFVEVCITPKIPPEGGLVKQEASSNEIVTFSFFFVKVKKTQRPFLIPGQKYFEVNREAVNMPYGRIFRSLKYFH